MNNEASVQWYLAACDAIAERRRFSPLIHNTLKVAA